jgi:signal transduction histidine kinase
MSRLLLWLALLCASVSAGARAPAIQARDVVANGSLVIGRDVSDYRDASGKLSIGEIDAAMLAPAFVALDQERTNFGYDSAHHWLRFRIDPGPTPARLMLEVGLASLDIVELHTMRRDGGSAVQRAGDLIPWGARPVPHRNNVFPIDLDGGAPTVFYLHVASGNTLTVPITLWNAEAFERNERGAQLGFGLFYGLLAALFLYNLIVYLSLRDRAYLWYVAYVATFGTALFTFDGFAFEYFWPDNIWLANHALGAFYSIALIFGGLFAREFLDTARQEPWLDRGMLAVVAAAAALAFCAATGKFLDYGQIVRVLSFVAPIGAVLTLWIGVKALLRGYQPARYFLLAWTSLLFFVVLGALRNFALVPSNPLATYGLHVGLALDVVLLSTALTARIRAIQGRMIAAQHKLLDSTRRHQAALEARARELADANRELEAFSHTVAHDLRAPLRAIDGFANLLRLEHREVLPEPGRRDIEMISRNARRMAVLVDGLLEFARLGRITPANSRVAMESLVESVLEELAIAPGVAVALGRLPVVTGDVALLRQVWANLIANAVKFSARVDRPVVDITARITADELVFSVADNGTGFDPAHSAKLFGMFQRLHSPAEFEGTGVGLATVKRIVERHGGRVGARAAPNHGACFEFCLPAWRLVPQAPD